MKYVKTAPIEAEQFDGSQVLLNKYGIQDNREKFPEFKNVSRMASYQMPTLEGTMVVNLGDYIATGIDGEHWAIKEDVFKKTYKPMGSDSDE